jgi:hypothetical protein
MLGSFYAARTGAIRRASSLVSSLAADRRPGFILEIDIGELSVIYVTFSITRLML